MKEIIIVPDENNSSIKGKFYETLMNSVFKSQRYTVQGNVNFTGMEFDLLMLHMDRDGESILVECKAKDTLSADEITKFAFNVGFKKIKYGYFLYTKNFVHQVAGIISDLKGDPEARYTNLYFWDAEKVIELLEASGQIKPFIKAFAKYRISKIILLYSYFGTFYVVLFSNSTIPSHFGVFIADDLSFQNNSELISKIRECVREVQSLDYKESDYEGVPAQKADQRSEIEIETVAEIQSSDSWYDYKPASKRYFVGRKEIQDRIFAWFDAVQENATEKRVFYLDGKSGWGKSSLLNSIKARTGNHHNKHKLHSLIIDSRSANSQNFIALAFSMLIKNATESGFLPVDYRQIEIESIYNILQSKDVLKLLEYLRIQNKLMILVFDQFEDIFRKGNVFDGFYKLLIDATNQKANICIGFSWKSEVNIPIDHRAYFLWQQMRDFAFAFTLQEFDSGESKKIVSQLEGAIGAKLDTDFVRKIIDNSQGFPWLVKKLCVHIYNQYNKGISLSQLYDQDFNVEVLFREDCEALSTEELKALKYIAKKAYDNDMVDEIDISETIDSRVKESLLLTKRMIIKTGTKYNIYWDIFRDFLVTDQVPIVGETYILRQHPSTVFEVFSLFDGNKKLGIDEVIKSDFGTKTEKTYGNILRELRNLGLLIYDQEEFQLRENIAKCDLTYFRSYINGKLAKHSFVVGLSRITDREIEYSDVVAVIKRTIKSESLSTITLETYAKIFIAWLSFAEFNEIVLSPRVRSRAENAASFTPQYEPNRILEYFNKIADQQAIIATDKGLLRALYDLKAYGIVYYNSSSIFFTEKGKQAKNDAQKIGEFLASGAMETSKIQRAVQEYRQGRKLFVEFSDGMEEVVAHINSSIYKNNTLHVLYKWAQYLDSSFPR